MADFRIFIDSDIIIDLLAKREHYAAASELFSLVERHLVEGFTTPIVLANVEYIIRKHSTKVKAKKALQALINNVSVLPMDHSAAKAAIASTFTDFEDAMQYYAAEKGSVQFIITRNKKDYAKGTITVMDAEEFVDLHAVAAEEPEV